MNFTDEGIGVGHEQPGTPTRQTWANLGVKTVKETVGGYAMRIRLGAILRLSDPNRCY